jgi:hypothetical protein
MNGICDNDFCVVTYKLSETWHGNLHSKAVSPDTRTRKIAASKSSVLWRLIGNVSVDKAIANLGRASPYLYEITVLSRCMCGDAKREFYATDGEVKISVSVLPRNFTWESIAWGSSANSNARNELTRRYWYAMHWVVIAEFADVMHSVIFTAWCLRQTIIKHG